MQTRKARWLAVSLAAALTMAACGSDVTDAVDDVTDAADDVADKAEDAAGDVADKAEDAAGDVADKVDDVMEDDAMSDGVSLAGVCPDTIVIQTDWNPEAEHGWIYEMIGDNPEIDASNFLVRGPLVTGGHETGVQLEIRTGGPAIGYQTVTSQMYVDDKIMLGYVYTDEGIQNSAEFPTVAVMAGMEKNPQMLMWDPETYPEIKTIEDIGKSGVTVRYFGGAAYMDYFTQTGILSSDQVDGSYDGTPALFIAEEGASMQQGFGSAEPYIYANEIEGWMKEIGYAYINDAGWENYAESIAVRADKLEGHSDCLELLVPIIQQSAVDFIGNPGETNALIVEAVAAFDNGWIYTAGVAEYSVATMIADGLLSNGPDSTIGNFDMDRVNTLIEKAIPVYESLGQSPAEGLTAEDVVTNRFIDESIGL